MIRTTRGRKASFLMEQVNALQKNIQLGQKNDIFLYSDGWRC
ncbi:hypothetical protein HMP0721_0367 [Pseudoramibacter alactolyticus ATCC 23263]|uniref:Uncharacterized protein n=1 Tax=Pseudoramibacter alactolyticus ATCC 23263 TaxID=887929 RepID=E6MED4_9FIRM|nr:hypothetical protein HMP0721_0367 [Pseudoramibacter alactolyticus ATCC 23263]